MKSQFLAAALCVLTTSAAAPAQEAPAVAQPVQGSAGYWEGEVERDTWPLFIQVQLEQGPAGLQGRLMLLGQSVAFSKIERSGDALTLTTGSGESTLVLAGRIESGNFNGRLREGTADLPFSLRPVKLYPKPGSLLEAWEQDLETLETRFLAADRSFSPAEREAFLEATAAIRRDLPRLNDAQITSRMAAAVALANNGHTRLYLLRNRQELSRLPIRLWWFSDGLYVIRATAAHKALLGCRVDSIGGWTARHARDLTGPLFAGTPGWKDYKTVYSLTSPETLHGSGVTPSATEARFTVSGCLAAGTHSLKPLPLVKSREPVEAWWDLSPRFQAPGEGWVHVLKPAGLPLHLRDQANYRFEWLPESQILYFQYNRSEQAKEEKTAAFGERLIAEIGRRKPKALVLDLRFNTGGNLFYAEKLMEDLMARTQGIQRFVITGRATFSAGLSAAVPWRKAGATFVGEPIGEVLDFWSEGGNIPLPNSGYDAHFANGMHKHSEGPCLDGVKCRSMPVDGLHPHVPATASWEDYRRGRDPAMAAVLRTLTAGRGR